LREKRRLKSFIRLNSSWLTKPGDYAQSPLPGHFEFNGDFSSITSWSRYSIARDTTCHEESGDILLSHREWHLGVDRLLAS
jgi:hypothetical protein